MYLLRIRQNDRGFCQPKNLMFAMMQPTGVKPDTVLHGYHFRRQLGFGQFSVVWEALHLKSNEVVAIKCVRIWSPQTREKNVNEVALLRKMDHPFIVRYFDSFEEDDVFYIVMEFLACGTLVDFSNRHKQLSEPIARSIFVELLDALDIIHKEYQIIHRDIKTENVLLDKYKNIRIVDFGLSDIITAPGQTFTHKCGSPGYISPEMARGQEYTTKADIWALGVILFAITHGYLPFDNIQKVIFTEPQISGTVSSDLRDILTQILNKNPSERPDISAIRAHPWISSLPRPDFKRTPVTQTVIARMNELGVNTENIEQKLAEEPDSEEAVVFRIVTRKYLIEENKDWRPKDDFASSFKRPKEPKASPKPKAKLKGLAASMKPTVVKPAVKKRTVKRK